MAETIYRNSNGCLHPGRVVQCPPGTPMGTSYLRTATPPKPVTNIPKPVPVGFPIPPAPPQTTAVAVQPTASGSPRFTPQNPVATPPQTTPLVAMDDTSAINPSMFMQPGGDIFGVPRNTVIAIGVGGAALLVLALALRRK
jgi:hypothetical protein